MVIKIVSPFICLLHLVDSDEKHALVMFMKAWAEHIKGLRRYFRIRRNCIGPPLKLLRSSVIVNYAKMFMPPHVG